MLVDHQIKRILLRMPFARSQPTVNFPPPEAHEYRRSFPARARVRVGKPRNLMTAPTSPRKPASHAPPRRLRDCGSRQLSIRKRTGTQCADGAWGDTGRLTKRRFLPKLTARAVELVDAPDLGLVSQGVEVRVSLRVPFRLRTEILFTLWPISDAVVPGSCGNFIRMHQVL